MIKKRLDETDLFLGSSVLTMRYPWSLDFSDPRIDGSEPPGFQAEGDFWQQDTGFQISKESKPENPAWR